MTPSERVLTVMLGQAPDCDVQATILQSYIQEMGPLSEEVADMVRTLIRKKWAKVARARKDR